MSEPETNDGGGFVERARRRRRMRRLEREKELKLRDVGGLVFELHRSGKSSEALVAEKLGQLDATDTELRALRAVLNAETDFEELREAGIAACGNCGELVGSADKFCAACGIQVAR